VPLVRLEPFFVVLVEIVVGENLLIVIFVCLCWVVRRVGLDGGVYCFFKRGHTHTKMQKQK
jgi:hypothetical protein